MPTDTILDTAELTRLNQQSFNQLVESVTEAGYTLTPENADDLRIFYDAGVKRLMATAPPENYEDLLSFSTGQLVNKFSFSTPEIAAGFGSFSDFLRSFCPLDPFC